MSCAVLCTEQEHCGCPSPQGALVLEGEIGQWFQWAGKSVYSAWETERRVESETDSVLQKGQRGHKDRGKGIRKTLDKVDLVQREWVQVRNLFYNQVLELRLYQLNDQASHWTSLHLSFLSPWNRIKPACWTRLACHGEGWPISAHSPKSAYNSFLNMNLYQSRVTPIHSRLCLTASARQGQVK